MPEQQPKTLQQRVKAQQEHNKRVKLAYERLFRTDDGKIVMEDILRSAHVGGDVFDSDALVMARDAGIQAFANKIKWMSEAQPEKVKPQETAE